MHKILTAILIVISTYTFGQNDIRFSQFNVAKSLLNPAAYGSEADLSFDLIYRNQWSTHKGAPATFGFTGSYKINPNHSIGLNFLNDQIGIAKSNQFLAGYAYHLNFNDDQSLTFGVNIGFENIVNDYSSIYVIDQDDEVFSQRYSNMNLQAGFGMYYRGPSMYIGYSIPFLFNNINFGEQNGIKPAMWHQYLSAGFYAPNKDESYIFNPSFQIKYVPNAPIQGDIILRNIINGVTSINVGYRSSNALIGGLDFMIGNMFRIGYSFNYNLNRYSAFAATSHELHLGFGYPYYYSKNQFQKRKYLQKGDFWKVYKNRYKKYKRRK